MTVAHTHGEARPNVSNEKQARSGWGIPAGLDRYHDPALQRSLISGATKSVSSRIATLDHEREAAARLVQRRYAWRGYEARNALDHGLGADSRALTLIAGAGETPTGTLTIRADGPEGLQADTSYRGELDLARGRGHRFSEVTRLALESQADSKIVLASIFSAAHWLMEFYHGCTHVLAEVNPRHSAFYRRTLGFSIAASERVCERVGAPGVLLSVPVEMLGRRVSEFRQRMEIAPALPVPS
jgi:hypothetical protein